MEEQEVAKEEQVVHVPAGARGLPEVETREHESDSDTNDVELEVKRSPESKRRRMFFTGRTSSEQRQRGNSSSSGSSGEGNLRGRRHGSSSGDSASSRSSWSSIFSSNMQRVRSISNMFSRASTRGSDFSDDDVSSDSEVEWSARILPRDKKYNQSSGRLVIDQVATQHVLRDILTLYTDDWFHRVLTQRLVVIMGGVWTFYTCYLLFFAGLYYTMRNKSDACALDPVNELHAFQMAFAFALETAATSGYGLPSNDTTSLWVNCINLPVVVWLQSFFGILINAFTIGLVVMRVGRADLRARQVVFSNKACITYTNGQFHLSFQVYDLDVHAPIVEAHVRTYAIMNESDGISSVNFQTRYMRLQNPSDDIFSTLFLSVPCTVVHAIDQWSPLLPPSLRREHWVTHDDNFVHNAANRYQYPNMILRETDAGAGERCGASCPVCGENFNDDENLFRHVRYQQYMEKLVYGDQAAPEKEGTDDLSMPRESNLSTFSHAKMSKAESHQDDDTDGEDLSTTTMHTENPQGADEDKIATTKSEGAVPRRGNSFHSHYSARSAKSTHSIKSSLSKSDYHHTIRYTNSQKRLEKEYLDQLRKGCSKSIHHHKTVRIGRVPPKIDKQLKDLADLGRLVGHAGIDLDSLITHDRVITQAEREQEELEEQERAGTANGTRTASSVHRKSKVVDDVRDKIRHFLDASELEIIVIVEGIEAQSSMTFQARHSYTIDDIVYDNWFVKCFGTDPDTKQIVMDLDKFHQVEPVLTEDDMPGAEGRNPMVIQSIS